MAHFANADLIAAGLSPLNPGLAALAAGRTVLREVDRLVVAREDFAFESTLSGLNYARRIQSWKSDGYLITILDLQLKSPGLALRRIASRVREGGHDVPRKDVMRRFSKSIENFERVYRPLADVWADYDNSGATPALIDRSS